MGIGGLRHAGGDDAPTDSAADTVDVATDDALHDAVHEQSADTAIDEPRGSRLDTWWAHVLRTRRRQRLWYWGGPIAVTLLAAVLRLWALANPHSLVFDETFYV
ncbi:MAG: phospholipid carrier-dependent glycosyltransferase, partial [Microterricola sp.]